MSVHEGQLEIDHGRGVIYFHSRETGTTKLRICKLPTPIPEDVEFVDITLFFLNGKGPMVSYNQPEARVTAVFGNAMETGGN